MPYYIFDLFNNVDCIGWILTDREAVEKRLFVLQQQGFINAYDTSWPAKSFFWKFMISHLSQLVRRRVKRKKKKKNMRKKLNLAQKCRKKAVIFSFLNDK